MKKISKYLNNLFHTIISALILLKYKDIDLAKKKSFEYYEKHIKL